jgi:PIN domain nuclease of toxin-antitoxin system
LFAALTCHSATFLWNNYKQALKIIEETPKLIARTMKDLGISDVSVFEIWIEEERTYLQGLKKEPAEETLQMDYYQKLVNLWASKSVPSIR